jgi:hypothetical protein
VDRGKARPEGGEFLVIHAKLPAHHRQQRDKRSSVGRMASNRRLRPPLSEGASAATPWTVDASRWPWIADTYLHVSLTTGARISTRSSDMPGKRWCSICTLVRSETMDQKGESTAKLAAVSTWRCAQLVGCHTRRHSGHQDKEGGRGAREQHGKT